MQDGLELSLNTYIMKYQADLHIHTSASDGEWTPSKVVEFAASLGLGTISITDHDTVDGIDEAIEAGEHFGVDVVPGVEISTVHGKNSEAHILGYYMDHHHPALVEQLRVLKEARLERGRQMVEQLKSAGVNLDFDHIQELAAGGAIGRPHIAKAICEIGSASSIDAAFGRFLVEGAPGYVSRHKVTPQEAVRLIIEAGGVPCCAHVAKLKGDELITDLIEHGMAAIEVYHPDHTSAGRRFYERFARKKGLIATGGSDAHCNKGGTHGGIGCVTVDQGVVIDLRSAAESYGLRVEGCSCASSKPRTLSSDILVRPDTGSLVGPE